MAPTGDSSGPKKKAAKKKVAAKKPAAKQAAVKKTAASKAPAKKTAAKKTPAKKAPPKTKAAAKKKQQKTPSRTETTIIARVDVGYGNQLFLRGEGGGLSWDKGVLMDCNQADEWTWSTTEADSGIVFKFLINDQVWSLGEDLTVAPGGTSISTPHF